MLAEELANRGNRVVVLIPSNKKTPDQISPLISVLQWPSKRPTKAADAIFLYQVLKKFRPCCVIAVFASVNLVTLLGLIFQVPVRIAWVQTLSSQIQIDLGTLRMFHRLLIGRKSVIYKAATHVVAVSSASKMELYEKFAVKPSKITVIHNLLIDPQLFQSREIQDHCISTAGRLDRCKGVDVLLRAIQLIYEKHPDIQVHIMGDGPQRSELETLVQELGITKQVHFCGGVPHDEVLRRLSSSYLFVHPVRMDNCPLAVIEALSVGAPVIACNAGGLPELIEDGIQGYLVPPDSPQELANALDKLLSSTDLRKQFSINAREKYMKEFNTSTRIKLIADWVVEICRE
jgi:glycosyltransferase involved in cell wall biosynthesis